MGLGLIFDSFFRALGQIGDKRFNWVLLKGIGAAILLQAGLTWGVVGLVDGLLGDALQDYGWAEAALKWFGGLATLFLSVFIMVPVASAICSLFLEEVAQAVEDRHYPNLPPANPVSIAESLRDGLSFMGLLIAANLVAFVLFYWTPLAPFVFWGLNGFLLGREYFMVAAMRRVGRVRAGQLWKAHSTTIWLAGTLMVVPLTIPLVNVLVPILGAATFTHLFHARVLEERVT